MGSWIKFRQNIQQANLDRINTREQYPIKQRLWVSLILFNLMFRKVFVGGLSPATSESKLKYLSQKNLWNVLFLNKIYHNLDTLKDYF